VGGLGDHLHETLDVVAVREGLCDFEFVLGERALDGLDFVLNRL
jgi:hypothetical protein